MDSFTGTANDLEYTMHARSERARAGTPASDPVFDRWLTHHLGRLYDPVVQEPLPDHLLRVLDKTLRHA